ncbi:MAG: hypothetical protein MI974_08115 [Chitinophagales bacterium]|nr:hypothetical protein [Chitinophagales bacterium]
MFSRSIPHLFLFCLFIFLNVIAANSQDYIHLLNDEKLEVNIKSVVGDYIRYVPYQNDQSETLKIKKAEVSRVKMANGTEIWYNQFPGSAKHPTTVSPSQEQVVDRYKKPPVPSQKLQNKNTSIIYPMNFVISGGITYPSEGVSSFDNSYNIGITYNNYYSSYLGMLIHASITHNSIDYSETNGTLNGALLNSWLMLGGTINTGNMLHPVRLYVGGMAGGNYMLPSSDLHQLEDSINLAYGIEGGIVFFELIHLGTRFSRSPQKIKTSNRTETINNSYTSVFVGIQF